MVNPKAPLTFDELKKHYDQRPGKSGRSYYVFRGSGKNQNQLANAMADRLYERFGVGFDPAKLSRVIGGERAFTPEQFVVFCELEGLTGIAREALARATVADRHEVATTGSSVFLTHIAKKHEATYQSSMRERERLEAQRAAWLPQAKHFFGREADLTRVIELISRPRGNQPLICSITGMPGVGKSALALHIAHETKAQFPDGVLWATLRKDPPFRILEDFGRKLGNDLGSIGTLGERADAWQSRVLKGKKVLLVLDNAESDEELAPLLPKASDTVVLITSRQDLAAASRGEVLRLTPLSPPDATQLLIEAVTDAAHKFGRKAETLAPALAHVICELAGYLPLAIVIAATQLAGTRRGAWDDFLSRLADERSRLTELEDDTSSVAATFAVSYESLSPAAQELFCLLTLFAESDFGVNAVAAIGAATEDQARKALEALVNASLLEQPRAGRYHLHDLLRLFANERLKKEVPSQKVRRARLRLLRHFTDLAATYPANYEALDTDHHNILAAIDWVRGRDESSQRSARERVSFQRAAIALIEATADYLRVRGHLAEGRERLQWAIEVGGEEALLSYHLGLMALNQGDYQPSAAHFGAAYRRAHREHQVNLAGQALEKLGFVRREEGSYKEAQRHLKRAMALFEKSGDRQEFARSQTELGRTFDWQGDYQMAQTIFVQSAVLQEKIEDWAGLAHTLHCLAYTYAYQGNYEAARPYFERALTIQEQEGDRRAMAHTLHALGRLYSGHFHAFTFPGPNLSDATADLQLARSYLNRSLAVEVEIGDKRGIANTQLVLAYLDERRGEVTRATAAFEQALALKRQTGSRFELARFAHDQGRLALRADDEATARSLLTSALRVERKLPDRTGQVRTLYELAVLSLRERAYRKARGYLTRSATIAVATGDRRALAFIKAMAGQVEHAVRQKAAARALWVVALCLFQELRAPEARTVANWLSA